MLHSGCDYLNSPFLNITQVSPFMRGSLLKVEWMGMHKEKGQGVEEFFFFFSLVINLNSYKETKGSKTGL